MVLTGVRKGRRTTDFFSILMRNVHVRTARETDSQICKSTVFSFRESSGQTHHSRRQYLDLPLPPYRRMWFGKDYFYHEAKCLRFRGRVTDPGWPFSLLSQAAIPRDYIELHCPATNVSAEFRRRNVRLHTIVN